MYFSRTQVSLGSDLWVRFSLTEYSNNIQLAKFGINASGGVLFGWRDNSVVPLAIF